MVLVVESAAAVGTGLPVRTVRTEERADHEADENRKSDQDHDGIVMPYAGFGTKAAWDTFHDAICADLGIPRPGKLQSDNTVQINNAWTDAQFAPWVVDVIINGNPRKVGIIRCPQGVIDRYALNQITDPVSNGDGTWTLTYQGTQYIVQFLTDPSTFPFAKPKPPTWTDPDTGIIYQVT